MIHAVAHRHPLSRVHLVLALGLALPIAALLALAIGTPLSTPLAPLACPYANVPSPVRVPVPKQAPEPAHADVVINTDGPAASCGPATLIERDQITRALAATNTIAQQARMVPAFEHGHALGFKMFAIHADSIFAQLGLQNGDIVTSINGYQLTDPAKSLEAYTKVKDASDIDVVLVRHGAPCMLEIKVVDEVF